MHGHLQYLYLKIIRYSANQSAFLVMLKLVGVIQLAAPIGVCSMCHQYGIFMHNNYSSCLIVIYISADLDRGYVVPNEEDFESSTLNDLSTPLFDVVDKEDVTA